MSLVLDGFLCNQVGILVRSFVKSVFDNAILKHSTWLTIVSLDGAMHEAVAPIAACGISPIVRIPDNQGWMVKRKSKSKPP